MYIQWDSVSEGTPMAQRDRESCVTRLHEYLRCFASLVPLWYKTRKAFLPKGGTAELKSRAHVALAGLSARNPRLSFRHDVLLLEFYNNLALLT